MPLLLAALLAAAAADDPLAPARAGKVQCYSPDEMARTCRSIAGYRQTGPDTYDNSALILVAPAPLTLLRTITPVTIKDGAVCGALRSEDVTAGVVLVDGTPLDETKAASIKAKVAHGLAPFAGKTICTRYVGDGDHVVAKVTIDGKAQDGFDQDVLWIAPDAGYGVAP
jgi:hypothetical protein